MRHQEDRRDSKTFAVVDEECSIPTSIVESHRIHYDNGPPAQADPRSYVLSMSDYDGKAHAYDVYDYQAATRPEQGQHVYAGFSAHPNYPGDYVTPQAQVPSGLPQSSSTLALVPSGQQYGTHDTAYYGQQVPQYPAYLEATPRSSPEITSYTPHQGQQGTKVTVYFQSVYDFDAPQVVPVIMFGQKRCESLLSRGPPQPHALQYSLCADAPPLSTTGSHSPQVPLRLALDESSVAWESPSIEFGSFTYLDQPTYYHQLDSPQMQPQPHPQLAAPRKRKLSPQASPRRSPVKKQSMPHFGAYAATANPSSPFRRPSMPEAYHASHARSFSGPSEFQQGYNAPMPRMPSSQYYGQPIPQPSQSPSWNYQRSMPNAARSPSAATVSTTSKSSQLLPSPAGVNPPLIRTSTLQQSPTTPGAAIATAVPAGFNPYAIYPSNSKAMLKLDKDLNTMSDKWTPQEWETRRRLVQFRRNQSGSVISATFEPVTLEDRIPNSICVSCIWWEEKQECYVTSVDTISLLESLVAVRFTVEEKNRIRRNLEGFRPATVSKTKPESEEFFKLIMGFPNPKPRNIEKDVKVFPWRILATALKKIIGKYASQPACMCIAYAHAHASYVKVTGKLTMLQSASYSSTAGALHTPVATSYSVSRPSDAGFEQRTAASPRSTSSSIASQGHAYAAAHMQHGAYPTHAAGTAGLSAGPSAGPPDLRIAVPTSAGAQSTSWHQPAAHYTSDLAGAGGTWDFRSYMGASPATGLPGTAQSYPYQQRISSLTGPGAMPEHARFAPLHGYDGHPTSSA